MHASSRNLQIKSLLKKMSLLIDKEDLEEARVVLEQVKLELGEDDPEVTGANTLISLLESTR
jgi:hypothetical protein